MKKEKIMQSISKFVSLLCCTAVLICAALTSQAQDAPTNVLLYKVVVKPGMNDQFEEYIGKFKEAVEKTGAPYNWLASMTFAGGGNGYHFVVPFSSWGTFAEQRDVIKEAFNKREVNRIMGLYQDSTEKEKTVSYSINMDISRPAPQSDQPNVAVNLFYITPKQGMGQQFVQYARKIKEATDATAPDAYYEFLNPGYGVNSFLVVSPVKTWKDLDTPPKPIPQRLTEHFGAEEGAKIMEQGNASIANFKSKLHVVRPDLARPPAQ